MNKRFAIWFFVLGLGLLLSSFILASVLQPPRPIVAFIYFWSSINVFVMAIGYWSLGPSVLAKQSSGRLPLLRAVFFFPLITACFLIWRTCRLLRKEDAFGWVDKELCVGRRLANNEPHPEADVVVDLTAEMNEPSTLRRMGIYVSLPILDGSVPPLGSLIETIDALPEGSVYVHCAQGHGRTTLFTIALLSRSGRITGVEEGLALIQKVRSGAKVNRCQRRFLNEAYDALVDSPKP
jgi:hypothetical protein